MYILLTYPVSIVINTESVPYNYSDLDSWICQAYLWSFKLISHQNLQMIMFFVSMIFLQTVSQLYRQSSHLLLLNLSLVLVTYPGNTRPCLKYDYPSRKSDKTSWHLSPAATCYMHVVSSCFGLIAMLQYMDIFRSVYGWQHNMLLHNTPWSQIFINRTLQSSEYCNGSHTTDTTCMCTT